MDWLVPMKALGEPTDAEERFYKAHAKTLRVVECAFGILKMRFRCLFEGLRVRNPIYACEIIKACAVLHKIALKSDPVYIDAELDLMDERAALGAQLNAIGLESEAPTEEEQDAVRTVPRHLSRETQLMSLFMSRSE
uniref:DDE Tnp4 domain-containing protein n=1 Tax=Plectus sambesii TaxID=2011161 RepID=A0A914V881_9BILA